MKLYNLEELILKSIDVFAFTQKKKLIATQDGQFFDIENEYEAMTYKREKKCASFLITRKMMTTFKLKKKNLNKKI